MKYCIGILCFFLCKDSFAQTGWFPLPNAPQSRYFNSIYFVNADTGFVSNENGNYRTTDGGATWTLMQVYGVNFKFFNHNKVGYSIGGVWKTVDSGFTWIYQHLAVLDIEFPSDSIGYSVGYSSDTLMVSFGKTTDGGGTWNYRNILPVGSGTHMRVVDVRWLTFRDELHGFVTEQAEAQDGSGGVEFVGYTADGGKTWIQPNAGGDELLFLHDSTWLATNLASTVIRTDNDFKYVSYNDSIIRLPDCHNGALPEQHICKFDTNIVSALSLRYKSIFRSIDAGRTWYQQLCAHNNYHVDWNQGSICTPTKLVGYAVGIDSQIYKTIDGGGPPFTNAVKNITTYSELQLLVNPVISFADFQFSPFNSSQEFHLFDLLGRELLRREVAAGERSLHLDMHEYPAGIYFARLGDETVRVVKY